MKYSNLCILCILVSAEDNTEDMFVSLVSPQIQSGTCETKDSELTSKDEKYKCFRICQDEFFCDDLSRYPWLCREGCQQACSKSILPTVFIQHLEQKSCVLSWKFNQDIPVRFIIGVQDRAGMLKILRDGTSSDWINLSSDQFFMFKKIFILVVSAEGLVDKTRLELNPLLCNPTMEPEELIQAKPGSKNIIYPTISVLVLFCAISETLVQFCVLYRRRTKEENACPQRTRLKDWIDWICLLISPVLRTMKKLMNSVIQQKNIFINKLGILTLSMF